MVIWDFKQFPVDRVDWFHFLYGMLLLGKGKAALLPSLIILSQQA